MYNTIIEAEAAATDINASLVNIKGFALLKPINTFEPRYVVSYIPKEYEEQYESSELKVKYEFHYAFTKTMAVLNQKGIINSFDSEQTNVEYNNIIATDKSFAQLKKILRL
ncbi:MAG: hypothetical protein GY827_08395 [Cytophagales bacterium]|nr:hypothetical protein [Cytophagales bacterium]